MLPNCFTQHSKYKTEKILHVHLILLKPNVCGGKLQSLGGGEGGEAFRTPVDLLSNELPTIGTYPEVKSCELSLAYTHQFCNP